MAKKTSLPEGLYEVTLQLDCKIILDVDVDFEPIYSHELSQEMNFSDYICLMREIKTMAFIPLWKRIINKMHIVEINSTLSPHIVMSVWRFIHEQKTSAADLWKTREELYNEWCEEKALSHNWQ